MSSGWGSRWWIQINWHDRYQGKKSTIAHMYLFESDVTREWQQTIPQANLICHSASFFGTRYSKRRRDFRNQKLVQRSIVQSLEIARSEPQSEPCSYNSSSSSAGDARTSVYNGEVGDSDSLFPGNNSLPSFGDSEPNTLIEFLWFACRFRLPLLMWSKEDPIDVGVGGNLWSSP